MTPFISGRADPQSPAWLQAETLTGFPSEQPLLSAALPCVWPTLVLTLAFRQGLLLIQEVGRPAAWTPAERGMRPRQARCPTDQGYRHACSEPGCPRARVNPSQAAGSGIHIGGAVALGSPGISFRPLGSPTPPLLAVLVSLCIQPLLFSCLSGLRLSGDGPPNRGLNSRGLSSQF